MESTIAVFLGQLELSWVEPRRVDGLKKVVPLRFHEFHVSQRTRDAVPDKDR